MSENGQKIVVITGASTGIGLACAVHLAERGYTVLGGVRREADGEKLRGLGIEPLMVDVTDAASIAQAAEMVTAFAREEGICGLVNNAGVGVLGPVEFVTIPEWRRQFEVNVFGQIAMTQAMLPLLRMRRARGGSARIVMIGSIAGRIGQPILSPYCASKHALEAVSDALRLELKPEKIGVSLIEPGAIQSEIWEKGQQFVGTIPADAPSRARYGKLIDAIGAAAAESARNALPGEVVAKAVERCLSSAKPATRMVIGRDAKFAAVFRRFLSDRWFDRILMGAIKARDWK